MLLKAGMSFSDLSLANPMQADAANVRSAAIKRNINRPAGNVLGGSRRDVGRSVANRTKRQRINGVFFDFACGNERRFQCDRSRTKRISGNSFRRAVTVKRCDVDFPKWRGVTRNAVRRAVAKQRSGLDFRVRADGINCGQIGDANSNERLKNL